MNSVKLKIKDNKEIDLPIKKSSIGTDVIDITSLYQNTGYFTYDPGFVSTASCESKITYIDGDLGILKYRGYDVKTLCDKNSFLDVVYLLINGDLPNEGQGQSFKHKLSHHSLICEKLKNLFSAFDKDAHPMSMLISSVGYLASIYQESNEIHTYEQRLTDSLRLIAKISTISAMIYKHSIGHAFMYPKNDLSFTDNFIHMTFANNSEEYYIDPVISKALDKIFILHADHEQNASTSTVRCIGSTEANIYASLSGGIAALWGPAHGGANEEVIKMLRSIGDVKNIPSFIDKVKSKECRLMGFGHRVYKSYDPRAEVLKNTCQEVILKAKSNPLLEIALKLEEIALSDDYFISRKLYPNVDFYSGIIYSSIGIPSSMFTVLFALARTSGWVAHWLEMHNDENTKLIRPRQLYTGITSR